MNKLVHEQSAYLRHAANQAIDWQPWSDEAFDKAKQENKPVFLSTGAVWCHWCHVMATESFEDEETARLMNALFISIKLDRDERPDIDRRYQQAVAAMGGGSGWPLSVFLTPDREPFYGGTYFPPEDRQGRPGFRKVLVAVHDFYHARNADMREYSRRVMDSLKPEGLQAGTISESMINDAEQAMVTRADSVNGGFGNAPKFPMPGALEFLIHRAALNPGSETASVARTMLTAMASGGFHDHLGGGFHRYSVDEAWIIPHFEKMADDNAGLLRNYTDGYAVFKDEHFREVALGIIAFTRDVLSDSDGGFYASQDADVTPADEGGYFTWTVEDFRNCLEPDEFTVLSALFLRESGSMHHDPSKRVLFLQKSVEELARDLGRDAGEVQRIIQQGKEKLLACRRKRTAPFIDNAIYPSLNGMLISAYFHAYSVLGGEEVKGFAVKSLDRILKDRMDQGRLMHTEKIPALLEDYIHLADALIAGYEATAEKGYLKQAERFIDECLEKFFDHENGGFYDTESEVLGTRLKKIEDIPHPSANAVAIRVLLKLAYTTDNHEYRDGAVRSLGLFVDLAQEINVHAGAYFCSLDAFFHMTKLIVEAQPESELARAARALGGGKYTTIVYGDDLGRVIPCSRYECYEPIRDPARLSEQIEKKR